MAESITIKALQDASLDAKSLEDVVNGNDTKQVTTRLGENYPSVKKAIKTLFENGGLPATPFATKALMTASALVNDDYAMVTDDTDNNGLYVKTAGAWVKSEYDPLALAKADATAKANDAITTAGTNANTAINSIIKELVTYSKNLFDDSKKTTDFVISSSGELSPNTSYFVSDYIRINNGDTVYYTTADARNFHRIAYYDINKELIAIEGVTPSTADSVVAPANAFYVRASFNKAGYDINQTMISTSPITAFEPYALPVATGLSLSDSMKDNVKAIAENVGEDIKDLVYDSTEFVKNHVTLPQNLLIKDTVSTGTIISATGDVIPGSASSFLSDYIVVKPSTIYTASVVYDVVLQSGFFSYIAYFDANKNFIKRDSFTSQNNEPIIREMHADARYVRLVSVYRIDTADRMFAEGENVPHDSSIIAKLRQVNLDDGFYDNFKKPYYYDTDFKGTYSVTRDLTKYAYIKDVPSADIYTAFDTLMAENSDYITKTRLLDSVLGKEVSAYFFKAPAFIDTLHLVGLSDEKPTVFIAAGVHGHETLPPTAVYALASELCNEWRNDDMIGALRFNANYIIIPVSNPDAWVRNPPIPGATGNRKNANGVDIARNFPCESWGVFPDPESGMYSGPSAGSEPETKNIMKIVNENNPDVFYDFHNFLVSDATATVAWLLMPANTNTLRTVRAARSFFSKQTRLMQKQDTTIPASWRAGYSGLSAQGLPFEYAAEQGATISCTFELNRAVPDFNSDGTYSRDFDLEHSKVTFSALVNSITTCLDEIGYKY